MAALRPTTVPIAAVAPTIAPTLMTRERARCCFAGAIATPAGSAAVMPLTLGASAAAVPTGRFGGCCSAELDWAGWEGEEFAGLCSEPDGSAAEDDARACSQATPGLSGSWAEAESNGTDSPA